MIGVAALLGLALSLQAPQQIPAVPARADARPSTSPPPATAAVTDTSAIAFRAAAPPAIDGKDDDQVWRSAPPITQFKEWRPTEDKAPRFKTEAKVAYDASNLYVFVRAFDPHP